MSDVKQFKLTTGDEIICEIIEWADDDFSEIVIRRAFQVVITIGNAGSTYYSFRPWMSLQEGTEKLITVNTNHIVSEALPHEDMLAYYNRAVAQSELSEEEISEKIDEYVDQLRQAYEKKQQEDLLDENDNVISLFDKDKLH